MEEQTNQQIDKTLSTSLLSLPLNSPETVNNKKSLTRKIFFSFNIITYFKLLLNWSILLIVLSNFLIFCGYFSPFIMIRDKALIKFKTFDREILFSIIGLI